MIVFKAVTKNRKSFIDDTEYLDSVTYDISNEAYNLLNKKGNYRNPDNTFHSHIG